MPVFTVSAIADLIKVQVSFFKISLDGLSRFGVKLPLSSVKPAISTGIWLILYSGAFFVSMGLFWQVLFFSGIFRGFTLKADRL